VKSARGATRESLVLGLVLGLLEIVLSDTQQSRDGIEDIERAKGDSFDTLLAAVFASVASQMPLKANH
jgi:hypothetical protein